MNSVSRDLSRPLLAWTAVPPTDAHPPFPWPAAVLVAVAAGGAAACALLAPAALAGPAVAALVLAAAAVGWRAARGRPAPRPPLGTAPHDSLPESDTRLRLLESAVVHAHDAVAIVAAAPQGGPGRAVLYVNDAFCRLTGYARADVIGRSLHLLRGAASDADALARLGAAMDAGTPLRVEVRNHRKDGTPFWADLSAVPVPDADGSPSHWVLIQRDIDRRKAAERRARQTGQLLRAIIDAFPGPISAKDRDSRYLVMKPVPGRTAGGEAGRGGGPDGGRADRPGVRRAHARARPRGDRPPAARCSTRCATRRRAATPARG